MTTALLAKQIWTQHYTPIIGTEQVVYMLGKFQSKEAIARQITEGYQYTLWFTNSPIGYLSLLHKTDCLFISKIYLLQQERGKGYGKQMMEYAMAEAKAGSHSCIRLTVNKYNSNTISAYEKLGFVKKREVVFDIGNGYVMDDYEMVKVLK